jgi:hypothetical protein
MSTKQFEKELENIKPCSIDNLLLNIKMAELAEAIVITPNEVLKALNS